MLIPKIGLGRQISRLGAGNKRALGNFEILGLWQAFGADQDDAGDACALDALHVPAGTHGLLHARQAPVAVPAPPLAR